MSKRVLDGKPFTVAVSILIAVVLWFYVLNVENPTGNSSIDDVEVITVGESVLADKGLILTELSRDAMDVNLSGYRKNFLEVFRSDVSISLDVSSIDEAGEYKLYGTFTPGNLSNQENLSITENSNFQVTVTVKESKTVEIPIDCAFVGTLATDHAVEEVSVAPDVVMVTGPEDVVDNIAYGLAEVKGDKISQSFALETGIVLIDFEGNVIEDEHITLAFERVEAFVSVVEVFTLDMAVTIIPGGGATESDTSILYRPESILITGDREAFEEMGTLILGEMELADVFVAKTVDFALNLPEDLYVFGEEEVETVKVTVSVKDLTLSQLTVEDITIENVPEGYIATMDTDSLVVWIRGTEEAVAEITAEDITVVLDMEDCEGELGQQRVTATITLEKETSVGIVGQEYSIAVTLTEDKR